MEKQFADNLKNLETNMSKAGYTFSGDRIVETEDLEEELSEDMSYTQKMAELDRQQEEMSYGEEAQSWEQRLTAEEIEVLTSQHGQDLRGSIQTIEQQIGTEAAQALINPDQQQYLVGDIRGAVGVEGEAARRTDTQAYTRLMEEQSKNFEKQYGEKGYNQAFKSGYGAVEGVYGGYEPTGTYGKIGEAGRKYKREKEDLQKDKEATAKDMFQTERDIREGGLQAM